MTEFLTVDDIFEIHQNQIQVYGGTDGVRDIGLLESALAQPTAAFGGAWLHSDVFEMAAAYLFHLVQNHPFIDGNKRVGLEAALLFLELNDLSIEVEDDKLIELVLSVAQGQTSKLEVSQFFREYSQTK